MFFETQCTTTITTKKSKVAINWKSIAELWCVTCHMESHSVTCHLTERALPQRQYDRPVFDLHTKREKTELTLVLVIFREGQTVTHPTSNHLIVTPPAVKLMTSQSQLLTAYRYAVKLPNY